MTSGARAFDREAPIIVGGCPRSGTTLLRVMLDSHPSIACGPELKLLNPLAHTLGRLSRAFGPALRENYALADGELAAHLGGVATAILEAYRRRVGKPRVAEKTPQNVHVFSQIAVMLPRSPLVHIVRDGRDVVRSLLRQRWIDPMSGKPMGYNTDIRLASQYWVKAVRDGRAARAVAGNRYVEVRYEGLVEDPEAELRALLRFLDEPWDPRVLKYYEQPHDFAPSEATSHGGAQSRPVYRTSIGRWREEWTADEKRIVKEVAGLTLIDLGYCADASW